MTTIRAINNNCDCWKAGDLFDVFRGHNGRAAIRCNAADEHALLDKDGEDVDFNDVASCPDVEIVEV